MESTMVKGNMIKRGCNFVNYVLLLFAFTVICVVLRLVSVKVGGKSESFFFFRNVIKAFCLDLQVSITNIEFSLAIAGVTIRS